jgi:4-amino-4-deoxy-L-arabinose transferase-like glycosyltransferase
MDSLTASSRQFAYQVFVLALSVRTLAIIVIHVWPGVQIYHQEDPEAEHFARTLLAGRGWTNPYLPDEALPSALRGPIPSLLLAGILWLTGESESWFRLASYLFYSVVSTVTAVAMYHLGAQVFNPRVGRVTAVMFALYPGSIYYATNAMCDTALVSACLVAMTLAMIQAVGVGTLRHAAMAGLIGGMGALINPAILRVFAVLLIWWAIRIAPANAGRGSRRAFVMIAIAGLVVSPWLVRNRIVFGEWVFIRSNFGMELRAGNREEGVPFVSVERFHMSDPVELSRLRELGEPAFDRECRARALTWINDDPIRFLRTTLERFGTFWAKEVFYGHYPVASSLFLGIPSLLGWIGIGFAVSQRLAVAPILIPPLVFPLVYYITHVQARFRFPIDAFLLIFAAYFCTRVADRIARATSPHAVNDYGSDR